MCTHEEVVCVHVFQYVHTQIKNEGYPIIFTVQYIHKPTSWIEKLTHTSAMRPTMLKPIGIGQVFSDAVIFAQALKSR